ncbi:MAG: hypothetical protein JW993_00025 [Sedimentisphaerales bacterium]|nr:hypothetical protein [Sedimentisphaerales bacterium]
MIWEEKSPVFEGVIAGIGVVILLLSTLSTPRLSSTMTREELTADRTRKAQRIETLQTWLTAAQQGNESLRTQLATTNSHLEKARAQIGALAEERDGLSAQVASTTRQLQEIDGQFQALKEEMAKFKEIVSVQQVAEERDDAVERAKKAEERVRELTLQLNRAGIWP